MSTVTDPSQDKNRVMATIKMDKYVIWTIFFGRLFKYNNYSFLTNILSNILSSHVISDMYVTMSLFDSQAVKIHNQQETMRGNPRVVVATSVNPKMVGGKQPNWNYMAIR